MTTTPAPEVESDFTLTETAQKLRVSTRWIRDRIKAGEKGDKPFVEHIRRGHKIMFTAEQVEKLRMSGVQTPPVEESVTTGPKRGRK